jgi:hypothetical protein
MSALISSAQRATCGDCWQEPGMPCGDGWDHLSRYMRANRRGLISSSELQRAVHLSVSNGSVQIVRHAAGRKM